MAKNLIAAFLATCFATASVSQSAKTEKGEDGLTINPQTCGLLVDIKEALLEFEGEAPTGQKATSPKYDLEIYADKKDGSWSLVGDARNGRFCVVDTGNRGYPDKLPEKKWWTYFKQK